MADQIKVNDAAWKALPQEHKDAINAILGESFGKVSIVADANTAVPAEAELIHFGGAFCKLLCQLAGAAGHIACGRLPPGAQAICNAGVNAGEALCEGKCH